MPLGAFRLNSISKVLGVPQPTFNTLTATGGTITDYEDGGVWYRSHTFESTRVNKVVAAVGNAQTSTVQKKFGSTSALFDGTGDYLYCFQHADYAFGTGDFTIEMWVYNDAWATSEYIVDMRSAAGSIAPTLFYSSGVRYAVGGTTVITGGTLTTNTWHHIAISKSGTSTRLFINGTQSGSTYTDNNTYVAGPIVVGSDYTGTANFYSGYIDEIRVSKSARYTANFTSSATAFTNDTNTLMLLHCEGTNAAQRFPDDSTLASTFQVTSLGSSNGVVQYLIVAGGGAGGAHDGLFRTPGGGGAGGLKTGTSTVTATSYTVNVGAGGQGIAGRQQASTTTYATPSPMNGGNSSVFSVSATGGGGGGMYTAGGNTGLNGGSGGGGGSGDGTTAKLGGTGVSGEGFAGGQSYAGGANGDLAGGGGGGGKGGAGSDSVFATSTGGAGGPGVTNTYKDGTARGYAGGGGGAGFQNTIQNDYTKGGAATHGGGGGNSYGKGINGTHGTGGGGGGGNGLGYVVPSGGDGGSGTVVIRYPWNSANNL